MIYLFLAGAALWLLLALAIGWTAIAFVLGGFVAVLLGWVAASNLWTRHHRYDRIVIHDGKPRL